jgi:hypothetical protein
VCVGGGEGGRDDSSTDRQRSQPVLWTMTHSMSKLGDPLLWTHPHWLVTKP